ncbi:MAG TPA: sugar kinase, partial [bacterium]|nr:sugar kinase [bacterium]
MAKKVILFGELLLRLAPRGVTRFLQAEEFEARYTGAEANAGVSLANFGMEAYAVSRVPENEIGQACLNYLNRFRVNTEHVLRGGDRLGLFYLETGVAQRPSRIIYDRGHSAIRDCGPGSFDWERICAGKDWFHFSGTAPALGPGVVAALQEGLGAARRHGLTVSCDLNYRAKLWSPTEAERVMTSL